MIPPFQELMLPIVHMCRAAAPESIANQTFIQKLADQLSLPMPTEKSFLPADDSRALKTVFTGRSFI